MEGAPYFLYFRFQISGHLRALKIKSKLLPMMNTKRSQMPTALVVDGRTRDLLERTRLLEELLPEGINVEPLHSLDEAAKWLDEDPWHVNLLVVDAHTPIVEANPAPKEHESVDGKADESLSNTVGSGTQFVNQYVAKAYRPMPPAIVTYRSYDVLPPIFASKNQGRIACVIDAGFTRALLQRKLEEWGISIAAEARRGLDGDLLALGGPSLAESAQKNHLEGLFAPMLEANSPEESWELIWNIAGKLDTALRMRYQGRYLLPCKTISESTHKWLGKAPLPSQKQAAGEDLDRFTWFRLLDAELVWSTRPVDALYLVLEAMHVRVLAKKEPLGQQAGEAIYMVASRIGAKLPFMPRMMPDHLTGFGKLRWKVFACHRLPVRWYWLLRTRITSAVRGEEIAPLYDYELWHRLIRDIVSRGLEEIQVNKDALIHLEREMESLRVRFEESGNTMGALEVEARSCQIRKYRFGLGPRLFSRLLEFTCDYGNQPVRLFFLCAGIVLAFALLYQPMPRFMGSRPWLSILSIQLHPYPSSRILSHPGLFQWLTNAPGWVKVMVDWLAILPTSVYVSIETFLNLGYGDFGPDNVVARLTLCFEGVLGLLAFGILIAVVSTKLRPR